jgi:hypothetical protein
MRVAELVSELLVSKLLWRANLRTVFRAKKRTAPRIVFTTQALQTNSLSPRLGFKAVASSQLPQKLELSRD